MYFLNKGIHSVLPSLFLEGEDLPFWQHIIQTLALMEFVSCCWDSTICQPSTPHSCFVLAAPSLTNFMPLGFHSTINLLLSMEMCRSWWGNIPLAWRDHFLSAVSPQWAWQRYHACTVQWSWCNPNGTRVGGEEDLSLASVSVLDLALQDWRHSAFSPYQLVTGGRVSLSETQEARKLPCTYSVK